jgi:hypothetical protein
VRAFHALTHGIGGEVQNAIGVRLLAADHERRVAAEQLVARLRIQEQLLPVGSGENNTHLVKLCVCAVVRVRVRVRWCE